MNPQMGTMPMGYGGKSKEEKVFDLFTIGGIFMGLFFVIWGVLTMYQLVTDTWYEWAYAPDYLMGSFASMTWLSWLGIDLFESNYTIWLMMLAPIFWGAVTAITLWRVRAGSDWADRGFQILSFLLFLFTAMGAIATYNLTADLGLLGDFLAEMGLTYWFPVIIAGIAFVWYFALIGLPYGPWQGVLGFDEEGKYFLGRRQMAMPAMQYRGRM